VISACNPEKKIAINYVSKAKNQSIMVIFPDYIYKKNLKTYLLDSLELDESSDTSEVLLENSEIIGGVNDSLFIANYESGYKRSLEYFGIKVYDEKMADAFLSLDSNAYQVNIAQLELEETLYSFRDEGMFYDQVYFHDHNLNAVYINSWFEISDINTDNGAQDVYFTTDLITDLVDGAFDYDIFKGKVRYMYNIDSLKQDMLYEFAFRVGVEYGRYTFDLLLNSEIDNQIDGSNRSETYWRYDPQKKLFFPALDDKFIPLK
jgi:hypothetical protein